MLSHSLIVANLDLDTMTTQDRQTLVNKIKQGYVTVLLEDGTSVDLGPIVFSSLITARFDPSKGENS